MPIWCSNLPNDQDMIKALGSVAVPCSLFTDVAFWGKNDNNATLCIGVERKKVGDLVQCIYDGRLLHQAQIAVENGIDVFCLVVEGRVRPSPDDGLLEIPCWGISSRTLKRCEVWQPVKPTVTYSRFDQYLTELDYLAGIVVKRSENVRETAAIIKSLWDNFQTPPSSHNSLHKIFVQPIGYVPLVRPGLVRRVAKELTGIGWERSQAVAARFGTVRELADASEVTWREIEGIGKVMAERVVREINGNYKEGACV